MIYSKFTVADSTEDTEEISIKPVAFPCTVKPVYRDLCFKNNQINYISIYTNVLYLPN